MHHLLLHQKKNYINFSSLSLLYLIENDTVYSKSLVVCFRSLGYSSWVVVIWKVNLLHLKDVTLSLGC